MIETVFDLRPFFRERLESALARRGVRAAEETRAYLAEMMSAVGGGRRRAPGVRPLALQLADASEAHGASERHRIYRELGDDALCLIGLFADHLERRGVTAEYALSMGGLGYGHASALAAHASDGARIPVYQELAQGLAAFARVLDDVRETTVLRTPQDIVRLYDKWRRTGSPAIAERLGAEGLFPGRGSRETH